MMELQALLARPEIEDIVINPRGLAFYSRARWTGPTPSHEIKGPKLMQLARHIAEQASCTLGLTQPSVDAFLTLPDGSTFRAHVVISPLVLEGPEITLRRLPIMGLRKLEDFVEDPEVLLKIKMAVKHKKNFLIAGSTGSGKSTFITALMREFEATERVLLLEDSPELPLPNPLSAKLLSRSNRFGFRSGAAWDLSTLVYESLRMRPDRMILGECRGPEALAIAQALQTGHGGLMTTIHSGSAEGALERFQQLAQKASPDGEIETRSLWHVIMHIAQNDQGQRRVREIKFQ